ncbi:ExeA family protein, partial [Gemmatimonadota bacterium]
MNRPPFSLTPDPEMLYMSRQHQEGLLRLKYAVVSNKGGALLISENAGDGKTSLLARLRGELDDYYKGNCRIVFIDHPTLTANQMVGEIARQLGVGGNSTDKLSLLNDLRTFLLKRHEHGEKCVVMLDEGQMLCHRPDLLQELRILLNFCVSDAFLLTFILSGQKPLDETIRAMPEFYQRLPVRFFLRNLNMDDTRELIRHRLKMAGSNPARELFSEDGYAGIYNHSKGCPRVICSVADLALVIS